METSRSSRRQRWGRGGGEKVGGISWGQRVQGVHEAGEGGPGSQPEGGGGWRGSRRHQGGGQAEVAGGTPTLRTGWRHTALSRPVLPWLRPLLCLRTIHSLRPESLCPPSSLSSQYPAGTCPGGSTDPLCFHLFTCLSHSGYFSLETTKAWCTGLNCTLNLNLVLLFLTAPTDLIINPAQ